MTDLNTLKKEAREAFRLTCGHCNSTYTGEDEYPKQFLDTQLEKAYGVGEHKGQYEGQSRGYKMGSEDMKKEINPIELCKCGKQSPSHHTCPFRREMGNDNQSYCNCCEECEKQCAEDI